MLRVFVTQAHFVGLLNFRKLQPDQPIEKLGNQRQRSIRRADVSFQLRMLAFNPVCRMLAEVTVSVDIARDESIFVVLQPVYRYVLDSRCRIVDG
jgi:hypothetical protein